MKKLILIFLLIFNLISARTIVLATDPYPPFGSPDVEGYGFFAEIVKTALKEEGYDLKIEFVPWKRALEMSAEGYYDGVMGGLYSEERAKKFVFSDDIYKMGLGIFVRKDFPYKKNELKGKKNLKVGQVRGYIYPDTNKLFSDYTVIESPTLENSLNALINKRVDVIVEANTVIRYLLDNNFKKDKDKIVELDTIKIENYKIFISKKVKDGDLVLKDFNRGLGKIKKNGTYNKILKKWGVK